MNLAKSISDVFFRKDIQSLLREITRYEEKILFSRRTSKKFKSPKMMFLTTSQLEQAKRNALSAVEPRKQMPPIMEADMTPPKIICKDDEIIGFNIHKIMFVDISRGFSNRERLMSVREPDGTLRFPTQEERSRLNYIFYPNKFASLDPPKMFEDEHLQKILKRRAYKFVLDRACLQYEPDDPRYVQLTSKVYDYIDDCSDFKVLRSTRHFGPMSLYLAYNNKADNLIIEMIGHGYIEDASKMVQLYNVCHNIETLEEFQQPHQIIQYYIDSHTSKKALLQLALQSYLSKNPP